MSIIDSKSYKLCKKLNENGFKAKLMNVFSYTYDKDYSYLCVHVEIEENMKLRKLWDLATNFEIRLARWANKRPEFVYELHSDWNFGEFVEQEDVKYNRKMNAEFQKVYKYEEWQAYEKNL